MGTLASVTLTNKQGMVVEIINFGARIKSVQFPVKGKLTEMTVGYKAAESYLSDAFYLGATCGRVCNRIENASFDIEGETYFISQNEGEHCLHGGFDNFSHRYWKIETSTATSATLSLSSKHLDQGFPGNLDISVTYKLTDDNQIIIAYKATTDCATPINITNHTYFSLGEANGELLNLKINASTVLERKANALPSGNILAVDSTDFDFRDSTNIGARQKSTKDNTLKEMMGFDHCFVLDSNDLNEPSAELVSPSNKIKMTLFTEHEAVQFYSAAYLTGQFLPYQGVCLEAQNYSNAINVKHFPESILWPQETYEKRIIFKFESI